MRREHIIPLLILYLCGTHAARILFLYYPSFSHTHGALQIASELASRGHVVWNALPSKLANDKRLQISGVDILRYESVDNYDLEGINDKNIASYFENSVPPLNFEKFKILCDLILRDKELLRNIEELNFDLIILDGTPLPRMLTIIPYKLNIPFVFHGAIFEPYTSRTPDVAASDPSLALSATPVMDFWTRVLNFILCNVYYIYDPFSYYGAVGLYAPEKPYITMDSLTAKGLLWLIDQEPYLDYPKALLPNVKFVGSMSTNKQTPLPSKYQKFMDEAKDGAVIVSFGSQVNRIPTEVANRLIDAFSQTQYRYIFRSQMNLEVGPNIMLTRWMPQSDLLAHPNTKLLITHSGANSQNEAFIRGIPMIGFPIFAEQRYSAMRVVYNGFGIRMELKSFVTEELVVNINEVINNGSYSKKIKKAAEITKLRARTPKEEAIYWIEHVLQYGGDHLRSYCQDMPLYQYLNLDVIGLLLFLLHLIFFLSRKLFCFCCRKLFCAQREQKLKQE